MVGFSKGSACPTCGRSGGDKGNLVSTLDLYTQSVYLTEDAFVFQNPYWHRKMIPDPQGYLDLQKLLHKKQAPDADNKLELSEKLEDGTGIFFLLYKLKCLWIYTNRLLCQAPYSGRDWFKEATFFIRTHNEDLPYFGWLKGAIKARWTRANYIYDETANDGKGEWKKDPNPINPKPLEDPKPYELDFLRRVEELVKKYLKEYTYTDERLRDKVYAEEYLNEVNKVVDEFDEKGSNKWPDEKFRIPDYGDTRLTAYNEFKKLRDHIEKKIDNTRRGYELYVPVHFEKVNEDRMIITLKRDFTSEWYQRAFELYGFWTFQKRPFTKQQLEEWNELRYTDGTIKKEPLKSHIFCPTEGDVGKSEDYAFDHFKLIDHKAGVSDADYKLYLERVSRRILSTEVEEVVSRLEDLLDNASDLANASDETIENFIRAMKNVDNNPEMERSSDDTMKNRIKKVISGLDEEIKRRKGTREYAERLGQERQEDRTRREEAQRRLRNIETQLANAADDSTRRRLREQRDELQGEIDNLDRNVAENDRRIDNTQRNLRGLNSNLRDLFDRYSWIPSDFL